MIRILILLICLSSSVYAVSDTFKTYMKEGRGVRAMSMGDAFTAMGEAESALYYNPAGLAMPGAAYTYQILDYNEAYFDRYEMHSYYSSPIGYSYVTMKNELGEHLNINLLGYGRRGKNGIDWGVSYKGYQGEFGEDTYEGWSSDIGVKARVLPVMNVGLVVKDAIGQGVKIPSTYAGGVAFYNKSRTMFFTADMKTHQFQGDRHLSNHYGAEYVVADGFIVRGGWSDHYYTAGIDFDLSFVRVQYGFQGYQDGGIDSQYMLGFMVGPGVFEDKLRDRYSLFKPKAYAVFSLGGNLTGGKSEISIFGGQKVGSNDLLSLIHRAGEDDSCRGFIIRLGNLGTSLSSVSLVQEIRSELLALKKKGKEIIIYLEGWANLSEYYLASIGDMIVMPELGSISHLGLELEVKKTKEFLKNFGLERVIISSGKFKDALNPGSETLTDFERVYLEGLVGELYAKVVQDIKDARTLDWDKVAPFFDGRLMSARQALDLGLVDRLTYYKDLDDLLEPEKKDPYYGEEAEGISKYPITEYIDPVRQRPLISFDRIAVVEIDGGISGGGNSTDVLFGGKTTGANEIDGIVKAIKKDRSIKGVIIRVNSPGGSVMASDRIYRAFRELQDEGKVVYASMGNIAASGGYYVSLGAQKIYANPGSLTGSVGVISSYLNFTGLNEKLKVDVESIKTGEHMGLMSSQQPLTDEQRAILQAHQDQYYQLFVDRVIESRGLTREEAYDIAQGQVVTGEHAVKLKMIDGMGGFYDVVDALSKELELEDPDLVFVRPQTKFSIPFARLKAMADLMGFTTMYQSLFMQNEIHY